MDILCDYNLVSQQTMVLFVNTLELCIFLHTYAPYIFTQVLKVDQENPIKQMTQKCDT